MYGSILHMAYPKRLRKPQISGIYVIQGLTTKLVKIGISENIHERLIQLQSASPDILELKYILEGGGALDEKALHAQFCKLRMHGEWFHPDIINIIENDPPKSLAERALAACIESFQDQTMLEL